MTGVVAVVGGGPPSVQATGEALAELLHVEVRRVGPDEGLDGDGDEVAQRLLDELADPAVLVAVMPDGAAVEGSSGHVISAGPKPVVVVPDTLATSPPHVPCRVLLPLDGSWEAAAAVAPAARFLADAGVELVVLHVFDESTVPRFWDQAAHARNAWESEFLARYCSGPGVRLRLRTGAPGESVVTAAAQEHVDLIVMGWAQRLDPDSAATVRRTIHDAQVPVLLVPVSAPADLRADQPDPPAQGGPGVTDADGRARG